MEMISTTGTAAVSPLFIIALAFGAGLGIALICFSFFNRKKLPKGMSIEFAAVGVLACVSAALMLTGLLS